MFSSPLHKDPRLPELYVLYAWKQENQARIRALKKRIQSTHDVLQLEELKSRRRVLRRLGFTTSADIVDMKGRVACEISTGDELLLTELIFNGVFNPLSPEQCAALLSCFVFTEKVSDISFSQLITTEPPSLCRANKQQSSRKSWPLPCVSCRK
jgi:ATP-dependent RNA helicase DOB1